MTRWWQPLEDEDVRNERLWEWAQDYLADEGIDNPTDAQIEARVDRLRESEDDADAEVRAENHHAALMDRRQGDWDRYVDSL